MSSRRRFLSQAAALGVSAAATGQVAAQTSVAPAAAHRRTYVLVHGAWHGGWCWVRVADRLRAAGHTVFTPTLTGLGERSHLISSLVNLDTHINDVIQVVEFEELSDVVLVGHSYAGTIIAGVADRIAPRLKRLVFLDSQFLDSGKSLFDSLPKEMVEQRLKVIRETGGGVGAASISPTAFGVKDPADVAWVTRRLTPQPVGCYSQVFVLKNPMGNGVPKVYIDCTVDPIPNLNPMKARARSESGWTVKTLATGHDAMVTAPGPLTEMLIELAA
jgi:pimeloyl-ACP methyl ester carboxylesterase